MVLTGVGGQGIITAANALGKAAVRGKINVYVSEVHGMAQRSGAVICTVRIGDVFGPMIATGTADVILSTEPIEALRNIMYASKKTKVITDINPVIPFTVATGCEEYPNLDDVFQEISSYAELFLIDATEIAKKSGDVISKNIVMLGALAATDVLPFKSEILLETILDNVPSNYKDINKRSFKGGMKAIKKY
ncbi:MAG: indolepyruvate ferredoxin oxidoreductase subunit beta [Thermoplasmatales archaeon]|nr:MAG: indolepyruvate ferredoxin oxidoreductase subunit beta [Thermoplasmatales archaeon]